MAHDDWIFEDDDVIVSQYEDAFLAEADEIFTKIVDSYEAQTVIRQYKRLRDRNKIDAHKYKQVLRIARENGFI